MALVSLLARSKPKILFLGFFWLRNETETLATQASSSRLVFAYSESRQDSYSQFPRSLLGTPGSPTSRTFCVLNTKKNGLQIMTLGATQPRVMTQQSKSTLLKYQWTLPIAVNQVLRWRKKLVNHTNQTQFFAQKNMKNPDESNQL